ncbi:hypothetical protein Dsin_030939 [Dipteronia sinensis]|uniref:Biogenesis of lysosome-related organelles complex 1 subunit 1 n=1 Tax=Dipteronia sinensis TaxID=43782 RepID=A0AAD9ZK95_9ROSI|nr:hypothetical protein Dsin_030939 [Dipteronia sinensis]
MASPKRPPARTRVLHQPETEIGGLEGSLLQLLQNHQHSSLRLREQTERAKKESISNAKRVVGFKIVMWSRKVSKLKFEH